jgi:uncharacterized membrane protein YraQ (UPF0718 family)
MTDELDAILTHRGCMSHFIHVLVHYLKEIIPALAVGFFISGLVHELIPEDLVEKHLGRPGIKPILWATLIGAILPVCCWGSLPIAVSFYKKGAKLGPILAFLTATPATSISALIVTYSILGFNFAAYSFFSVIIMGLVVGMIGNAISAQNISKSVILRPTKSRCFPSGEAEESLLEPRSFPFTSFRVRMTETEECPHCKHETSIYKSKAETGTKRFFERLISVLNYAFIKLPKEIGLELIIGLILAAVVATFVPIGAAIHKYLAGWAGYAFSVVFGIVTYICATASVPFIDSLIGQGLSKGAGMTLLLIGPITSYGTILVLRKEFGLKTLAIFLLALIVLTVLLGLGYQFITG